MKNDMMGFRGQPGVKLAWARRWMLGLAWLAAAGINQGQESGNATVPEQPVPVVEAEAGRAAAESPIVVTATREGATVEATATSVSVVTREQIIKAQYRSVADAVRATPGTVLASNGAPGQLTGVFIRGSKTSHNTVRINGRRLPSNLAGAYNLEDLGTENVDRIEIARGPLSAVHGGSAAGGVINIITRDGRDTLERPELSVSAEGGSFHTFSEVVAARGAWGPWDMAGEFGRLDTDYQRTNNEYRRTAVNTSAGVQISRAVRADLLFLYNLSDAGSPNNRYVNDAVANLLRETWTVSPGVEAEMTEWWTQKTWYAHSQLRQVAEKVPPISFFGMDYDYGQDNRIQVDTDEVESQGTFQLAEKWQVTAGGTFLSERYSRMIDVPNEFAFPAVPAGTTDIEDTCTQAGVFGEMQWEPLPGWHLVGNLRYDHYSDFDDPVTWRVGGSYRIEATETVIHANYGTAFAPPTPQDVAPAFGGGAGLEAERSRGYEAGVTQTFAEGRFDAFATWFHQDVRDLIEFRPSGFDYIPYNIGEATLEGVETGLTVAWIPEVKVTGSYTYLTAEDEDNGTRLVRRPRHQATMRLELMPLPEITFLLEGTYVADREDSNPVTFAQQDNEDYFLMRLAGSWKVCPHTKLFARVENLTNDQYEDVLGYPALDIGAYGGVQLIY